MVFTNLFGLIKKCILGVRTQVVIYGSLLLFVFLFILRVYLKGKTEGRESLKKAISIENEKIRQKWDKIDSTPTDFDTSVERLRNRIGDTEGSKSKS
jgi:hypothetical protein